MSVAKLSTFLTSLHGEWGGYPDACLQLHELERGMSCMRVYRNNDGTWALMPNWFKTAEQNHKRGVSTIYETFDDIPDNIQSKLAVLLLKEPGGDWLSGVGKRVDNGVFWLEDG